MKRFLLCLAAPLFLSSCAQHNQTALKAPPAPSAPSAMTKQILNAVDAGDGDAELRMLRARVIDSPTSVTARLELGKAYEQRGCPELALDHFRWAVEHSPESADAHLVLARTLDHTGHSAEALAMLTSFLEVNPQPSPTLYSWLGIIRDDAGDWKGSEKAYRDAMAKSAVDHDYLHNNLGYSLLKQGQSEKAAAEFRAALKLNPHSEIARDNLGISLSNNPKEAILNLQSLNEPAVAHSNLAAVLMEQGNYAEARKELQIALQYNQSNPAALKNLELLSNLDGKPVTVPVASLSNANSTAGWSRVKSTVRRWFNGEPPTAVPQQVQTAVQQKSESKQ
jgi:Flp pilus assembly protein TadD